MIRAPLSLLGGVTLALGLFWLLAMLVVPPEAPVEIREMAMPLGVSDMPQTAAPAAAPSAPSTAPLPAPPLQTPPRLSTPEPAPAPDAELSVPEQTPPEPTPEPAPEPEPAPKPEPAPSPTPQPPPEPEPEPEPEPAREPPSPRASPEAAPSAYDALANSAPSSSGGSQSDPAPRDVGQATPVSQVPPEYPARAQRRNIEGHVVLTFLIRPDGSVDRSSIQVTEAQPRNVFARAAKQAIAKWRFESTGETRRARQRLEFRLR
ncbi:protein TonB [Modicisalibacter ilicicola DSM 19980]|uniref:Protein TonB n=1 Tax=Modicisalibacter ilicicola DSM 19980 TaxID=1121942 RepID=A0A1M5CLM4_9GAMM|nr:energy transducer TonB [Halomonas ilicicola]SHF55332.1 protein TonB [Halomonas ilicicola DSM 19980]